MKNVSAAIIKQENTVLLTRRAQNENLAGYWEFPGGKQEKNETIQQCLERELEEDLSIITKSKSVLIESRYEYSGGVINLIAIDSEILNGEITLSVHDKFEWVAIEKLLDYKLAPADIPIAKWIMNN